MANQNKEIIPPALEALLTQDDAVNNLILRAYKLGQGDPSFNWIFQNRLKTASAIIRAFGCSIEYALRVLSVPKKERPPIVKTLETQAKAKRNADKHEEMKNDEALE